MPRKRKDSDDDDDERSDSSRSGEESDIEDDGEEEEEEEGDEDEDEELQAAEAKHKLVEADLAEIKKMMEEMDKIKMRLQFRLAREQSGFGQTASSPSQHRSSLDEVVVPPTVAAAVQTAWDMPRKSEVEKLISSTESKPTKPETRNTPPPIALSIELSMEDLAKSYGIDGAVFGMKQPSSPVRQNSRKLSAMEDYDSQQPTRQAGMGPPASIWDGLIGDVTAASDLDNDSMASTGKPPKLNRSQLIPDSESGERPASPVNSSVAMLEDSFGTPASPTHSDAFASSANSHIAEGNDRGKTMEQKEMEAMKNLLFF